MGKREEEDSKKSLARERIKFKTRFSLKDILLWPIRAYQQKRREAQIRKDLLKQFKAEDQNVNFVYEQVPQEQLPPENHEVGKNDWLHGLVSEDDTTNKGE